MRRTHSRHSSGAAKAVQLPQDPPVGQRSSLERAYHLGLEAFVRAEAFFLGHCGADEVHLHRIAGELGVEDCSTTI